jgi:hypothetical protein
MDQDILNRCVVIGTTLAVHMVDNVLNIPVLKMMIVCGFLETPLLLCAVALFRHI